MSLISTLKISRDDLQVFSIAFSLLLLEVVFFKSALYIHDYLNATLIVSYALIGLGLGAWLNYYQKNLSFDAIALLKTLLILSVLLSFVNFVYSPANLFLSPIIILPFLLGSIVISHFLRKNNSHRVYFFDLAGATLGVFSSLVFIPALREEGSFFAITALLALSSLITRQQRTLARVVFVFLFVSSSSLLAYSLIYDGLNFARIIKCSSALDSNKIFCWNKLKLVSSKGSNVQRLDIIQNKKRTIYVAFDGLVNDHISPTPYESHETDPRIIDGLVEDPKFLIIGTAAQGIVKVAKAQDPVKITGLEINRRIIELMKGPMLEYSKNAYDYLDELKNIDARTFLMTDESKYDIITLINTYPARTIGHFSPPEYLHTYEAINSYFDHLTDRGAIVLEERNINERAELGIIRIINTFMQAMKDRGFEDPKDHIFVYSWYGGRDKTTRNIYTGIVIKRRPFSPKDWQAIDVWAQKIAGIGGVKKIIPAYPFSEDNTVFGSRVYSFFNGTYKNSPAFAGSDLTPISDDRPYPWAVYYKHNSIKDSLNKIGLIVLVLLALIFPLRLMSLPRSSRRSFSLLALYFGLIGLAYFIIEIALINFYQNIMGSPANSFIFILGTLLFSSGLGAFYSKNYSAGKIIFSFTAISLLSLFHLTVNKSLLGALGGSPLFNSFLVALTIFPLGYFMGAPFPYGLEWAKKRLAVRYTAIFLAINSLLATLAVVLSLQLSVVYGFKATFIFGVLFYFVAMSVLFLLEKLDNG